MIPAQIKAYSSFIIAGVAVVTIGAGAWMIYNAGHNSSDAKWQLKWAAMINEQMEAGFTAERKKRERETEWQEKFDEASKDAQAKINDLEADIAAASVSADGLRSEAKAYADRARRCAQSASATGERQTTTDPFVLYTDLLDEMERAGRQYAQEADRRGIAGTACEAAYTSLKKSPDEPGNEGRGASG